jgi:hypothetical protein
MSYAPWMLVLLATPDLTKIRQWLPLTLSVSDPLSLWNRFGLFAVPLLAFYRPGT